MELKMDNMHKKNDNNSRIAFLKKISLAFVSVFGIGFIGFKFQTFSKSKFKTISNKEANDIIRNMHSPKSKQLKPEPPPNM